MSKDIRDLAKESKIKTDRSKAVREVVNMLEAMYKCMDLIKEHDITEEDIRDGFESKSARNSDSAYQDLYNHYLKHPNKGDLLSWEGRNWKRPELKPNKWYHPDGTKSQW
jgi:hypothetical protein